VLTNSANLYNTFRTGGVDIAYLSLDPDQIASLKDGGTKGSWQVNESQGSAASYMVLNTKTKPLDNPIVRQAIASMVNRPLVNERSLKNQAEPLYSMVPTTFDVYKPVFKDQYGDGNTEKAKQLLQEAGYSPTNPLKLEVWYPSTSPTRRLAAGTLQALATQQFGGTLQFEVKTEDSASFFKNVSQGFIRQFCWTGIQTFSILTTTYSRFWIVPKVQPQPGVKKGQPNSGVVLL
jgi:peptide/nickel transport system substrate-binding protein